MGSAWATQGKLASNLTKPTDKTQVQIRKEGGKSTAIKWEVYSIYIRAEVSGV